MMKKIVNAKLGLMIKSGNVFELTELERGLDCDNCRKYVSTREEVYYDGNSFIICKPCYHLATFVPSGTYTVSNSIGYEIMLSDDGEAALVRYQNYDDSYEITDWLEVKTEYDKEVRETVTYIEGAFGSNIPMDEVMRINR